MISEVGLSDEKNEGAERLCAEDLSGMPAS